MRSVSQEFCDAIRQGSDDMAAFALRTHGPHQTRALMWLSLYPPEDPGAWIERLQRHTPAGPEAEQALMMALAQQGQRDTSWIRWLSEHIDPQRLAAMDILHHAAAHGRDDVFDILADRITLSGTAPNWNATTSQGTTPLYQAITQHHLGATVAVLMRGGSPTALMPDPLHPGQTATVLVLAFRAKASVLGMVKQMWAAASDKAALLAASPAGERSTTAPKKRRM